MNAGCCCTAKQLSSADRQAAQQTGTGSLYHSFRGMSAHRTTYRSRGKNNSLPRPCAQVTRSPSTSTSAALKLQAAAPHLPKRQCWSKCRRHTTASSTEGTGHTPPPQASMPSRSPRKRGRNTHTPELFSIPSTCHDRMVRVQVNACFVQVMHTPEQTTCARNLFEGVRRCSRKARVVPSSCREPLPSRKEALANCALFANRARDFRMIW